VGGEVASGLARIPFEGQSHDATVERSLGIRLTPKVQLQRIPIRVCAGGANTTIAILWQLQRSLYGRLSKVDVLVVPRQEFVGRLI
jgi:hypothetical protein